MNLFNIFKSKKSEGISDLTPRGIAKSIIPEGHGTQAQYNEAWRKIYSQLRNLDML